MSFAGSTVSDPNNNLVDFEIECGSRPKQECQIQKLAAFRAREKCSVNPHLASKNALGDLAPHAQPPDKRPD